jgi:hypothetical protein
VSLDQLRTGCIIRFPYLWVREAERGETEGRKHRPAAVGVRISRPKGEDFLVLFPITSQPPSPDRFAVEIPEMESVGLVSTQRCVSGSFLTNTIRTLSATLIISNRSHRLAGSARLSSSP